MLRFITRYLITLLSFPQNFKIIKLENKGKKIQEYLISKINSFHYKNKEKKQKIHIRFSNYVLDIIKKKKLTNFLRFSFIQKIFFIHNRFYIFQELKELKKDKKKWKFWEKLLLENDIGNPIRYFLYKKSSGNRIRQVYHLKNFCDYSNLNLKKIKYVIEIGGGYGCMASIFYKINPNIKYFIFDTKEVNLLQYYYLAMNNLSVSLGIDKTSRINLLNNINDFKKIKNIFLKQQKKGILIANWSISEMPFSLRRKLNFIYKSLSYILISFQDVFENLDNIRFFNKIKKNFFLNSSIIIPIKTMNNNIFSSTKNFYFFSKNNFL